tara:strand:- start:1076 stop:1195 length:120 start_codon:yes stop_codon:yes gene_type:complete
MNFIYNEVLIKFFETKYLFGVKYLNYQAINIISNIFEML